MRRLLIESAWTYRFPTQSTRHLQREAKAASDYEKTLTQDTQKRECKEATLLKHEQRLTALRQVRLRELVPDNDARLNRLPGRRS